MMVLLSSLFIASLNLTVRSAFLNRYKTCHNTIGIRNLHVGLYIRIHNVSTAYNRPISDVLSCMKFFNLDFFFQLFEHAIIELTSYVIAQPAYHTVIYIFPFYY